MGDLVIAQLGLAGGRGEVDVDEEIPNLSDVFEGGLGLVLEEPLHPDYSSPTDRRRPIKLEKGRRGLLRRLTTERRRRWPWPWPCPFHREKEKKKRRIAGATQMGESSEREIRDGWLVVPTTTKPPPSF